MESVSDCKNCKFLKNCIFDQLSLDAKSQWVRIIKLLKFQNEKMIYSENEKPENVFVVCKGRVKVYSTDYTGQQLIIWIRYPGEIFGHLAIFSGKEYSCNAQAMGETFIVKINKDDFMEFLKKFSEMYEILIHKMAMDNRILQIKLQESAYKPAKVKVAHTLIKHISYKTKDLPQPYIYGLKRKEIAEITGLAIETVVRVLSNFEKNKIIQRSTNYIKILDYQKLLKIAEK